MFMYLKISLVLFLFFKSCERSSSSTASNVPMEYDILWESAGDINDRVYCLLNVGATLFAGTYHGLFVSTDSGQTWVISKDGITLTTIRAMVEKDGNIFLGGGILEGGVSVSRDGGKSWRDAKNGLPNTSVSSLAVSGQKLYAGTFGYGVFVSEDNGLNWRAANKGLPATIGDVTALAADGEQVFACINSDTGGVFMTNDNGSVWFNISRGLPPDHADFTSVVIRDNVLLVSADGDSGGVFVTTNYGDNWRRMSLKDRSVTCLVVSGPVMIAGGFGGVQSSTDNGDTWFVSDNGLYPQGLPDVNSIILLHDRIFAGLNFGGVYFLIPPKKMSYLK
ncbi:hypothetical protein F9K33_08205 [bacterium]|nr:MAG: hypothetical protein F9K33_08205 [bacterium]